MQNKIIHTSTSKASKDKKDQKKKINIKNKKLYNNNELSKHKSQKIYNQYSPTNLKNSNKNNNNSKKNITLANNIKQINHYSGTKKTNFPQNLKEKDLKNNDNNKRNKIKVEYNNTNLQKDENNDKDIIKKLKKNNLDHILSESDSFQEIDSMEEDSTSKGNRLKSTNLKIKNINNLKWDIIDSKSILNNVDFKRHLTSGYNNNKNITNEKNEIPRLTKPNISKEKKSNNIIIINDNDENDDEDIIVNDNEFESSHCLNNSKLNETKFPKLSINPFIGESILQETNAYSNKNLPKKSIPNKGDNKNMDLKNEIKEKFIINNHHIKSSTLGTIKQSSTNPNSSNLSNALDIANLNNLLRKENNEKSEKIKLVKNNTNNDLKTNINTDNLYRNFLLIAKKGDREQFLEILEQILSLPKKLKNINFQDENGFTALHYSCDEGNFKIVKILLKINCETNIKNNEKKTPLHLASIRGFFDISKKLIENGALLNVYDSEKNSPLHYVCMHNYIELLKYFLTKLPQADEKNIYGKMPIDLTTNNEIKNILENYLKNNENSYHKIKIYQTSDSMMNNLIEPCPDNEVSFLQDMTSHSNKNNIKTNLNKSKNNSSLSPINKNPRRKHRIVKKDYNSIKQNNMNTKNIMELDLKKSNKINIENNISSNNIISSLNSSNSRLSQNSNINKNNYKKNELKSSRKLRENKDNSINSQKLKKEKINNKIIIQESNINNNNDSGIFINNDYNNINTLNNNYNNGLKKTRTLEQFSTINTNNTNKINIYNNVNKVNMTNDSKLNISNYYNINVNNSINNDVNRIDISFNRKNEIKKLNKSINRFDRDKKPNSNKKIYSENKSKFIGNNLKYKNFILDSTESSTNNIVNLNKTEENIKLSKIPKTSLKKNKNTNPNKTSKNINSNNYNTIRLIEGKEKTISKNKHKQKSKQNKLKKKQNLKKNNTNDNINNNCNISKISCGIPQPKNNNILEQINKSNIIDQTLGDNIHSQLNLNSIEEERITPSSFICLAQLGKGSFGEVYLVQKINTKEKFAMKVLRKERIMGQNLLKYAIAERNVLSLSNHPFIVKLNFAFQTSSKLFLILEYCPNGDLAKHLLFEKRFSEERAKFYICEVLLALENLHQRDIIFRDLKPDNVVLDEEGHCKLTDFGLSKESVNEEQYAKSFCGSIAYLAPEMLKKQGHGKAVDWYLLGVLFYEMLVGITPFFTTRKEDIFHNIEYGELKIPEFVSKEASSLLRGLLQKDPKKRLGGNIKDAQEIKEHPYFSDVDWEKVYYKKITPPPVNIFTNKMIHVYHRPRQFANDDYLNKISDKTNNPNMLPGWSFINNEEY